MVDFLLSSKRQSTRTAGKEEVECKIRLTMVTALVLGSILNAVSLYFPDKLISAYMSTEAVDTGAS